MLTLIVFPGGFGMRHASPFCLKADTLLRLSGLPFQLKSGDVRKSPRRKLPVLIDDGRSIPDSNHIQSHLESTYHIDFDAGLSPEQKAVSLALRRLIEDHLYWLTVHDRWIRPENGDVIQQTYLSGVPGFMRGFVFSRIRKGVAGALHAHGLGRHTEAEMREFGQEDLQALQDFLGEKPFFHGDRPTSIDAAAYGILESIRTPTLVSALRDQVLKSETLVSYCDRMIETLKANPPKDG